MSDLTLGEVDEDGAIGEAVERVVGGTRADFLRKATVGGAALLGALALPPTGSAATAKDVDILNFALTLEYLQASFYTEAERVRALRGKARRAAEVVGAVERAHVTAFREALGSAAVARPTFNFRGVTEDQRRFLKTAVAFEDLAVAAYKGQAPRLESDALLSVAISIHSVEARHAAWMRYLFGIVPAAEAFDEPLARPEVTRIVASTGFIVSGGRTERKAKPRFTG
ncbi:MAG: ferritin-like domain-containing protein [Gaiellaceae bacterium]